MTQNNHNYSHFLFAFFNKIIFWEKFLGYLTAMIKIFAVELWKDALFAGNQSSTEYLPFVKQAVPKDAVLSEDRRFPTNVVATLVSTKFTPLSQEYRENPVNKLNTIWAFEKLFALYKENKFIFNKSLYILLKFYLFKLTMRYKIIKTTKKNFQRWIFCT